MIRGSNEKLFKIESEKVHPCCGAVLLTKYDNIMMNESDDDGNSKNAYISKDMVFMQDANSVVLLDREKPGGISKSMERTGN